MNNFIETFSLDRSILSLIEENNFSELLMDALNVVEENSLTLDRIELNYEDCNDDLKDILDSYRDVLSSETEQMLEMIKEISTINKRLMH